MISQTVLNRVVSSGYQLSHYKFSPIPVGKLSVLATLSAGLVACGNNVDSTAAAPAPVTQNLSDTTAPTTSTLPSYLVNLSDADCARFLQQAQFSSTPQEIADVKAIGIDAWLSKQMAMPIAVKGYDWSLNEFQTYYGLDNKEYPSSNYPKYAQPMIYYQLITQPDQLRKRVALALSEIFVVSNAGVDLHYISSAIASYWDMLNKNTFGSFRTLLGDVTFHTLMGEYLDSMGNKKADPMTGAQADENYAREVMQLFAIGLYELNLDGSLKLDSYGKPIETYNNDTIANMAKIFTGLEIDSVDKQPSTLANPALHLLPMRVNEQTHDKTSKMIFGQAVMPGLSGKDEINNALDILFKHNNVAPFISRLLIQRLTTSNPSPAYISRVASIFNNNGKGVRGDMAAVIRAILTDIEARVPNTNDLYAGKVREPMVTWVQWLRTFTNRTSATGHWTLSSTDSNLNGLNQSPFKSPSVFNFFEPDYVPTSTNFGKSNKVAPEMYLITETSIAAYQNFFLYFYARGGVWSYLGNGIMELVANYDPYLPLASQPIQLANQLNLVLAGGRLNLNSINIIVNTINTIPKDTNYARYAVCLAAFLIVISPNYRVQV